MPTRERPRGAFGSRAAALGALALALAGAGCSFDFGRQWQADVGVTGSLDGPRDGPVDVVPRDAARDGVAVDTAPRPDVTTIPDAPAVPPELCFAGVLKSSTATCPSGWTVITGASVCNAALRANSASADDRWQAICGDGATALFTQAICAKGAGFRIVTASGAAGAPAVASCKASEVAMGAGCTCSAGSALRSYDYVPTSEGWSCTCSGSGVAAVRLACLDAIGAQQLGRVVKRKSGLFGQQPLTACGGGLVFAGGCDAGLLLVGMGVGSEGLDVWKCTFGTAADNATVTALCVSSLPKCP